MLGALVVSRLDERLCKIVARALVASRVDSLLYEVKPMFAAESVGRIHLTGAHASGRPYM